MKTLIRYPVRLQVSNNHGKNLKTLKRGAYFNMGIDKLGSVHLYINFRRGSEFTRVTISKGYVLDALLHSILIRPVRMPQIPFSWYHRELAALRLNPIENVDTRFINEYYQQAQAELLACCEKEITQDQDRLCRAQIQKITERQRAISDSILALDSISCARTVAASSE